MDPSLAKALPALKIRIRNFKSIKSTEIRLNAGLNILIGPNGSGKTGLLSALKFIRDLVAQGVGLAIAKGGGAQRNYHRDTKTISFQVHRSYGMRNFNRKKAPCDMQWSFAISQRGKEQITTIAAEKLQLFADTNDGRFEIFSASLNRKGRKPHFHVSIDRKQRFGRDLFVSYRFSRRGRKAEIIQATKKDVANILKRAKSNPDLSFLPRLADIDDRLSETIQLFLNLNEYNILPDVARQPADQLPRVEMLPNGRNLGEVIHNLEQRSFHRLRTPNETYENMYPNVFRQYEFWRPHWAYPRDRWIKGHGGADIGHALQNINRELSAAVTPIDDVSVQMDPTSGKRFVVFNAGRHKFFPEEVSDGTMKWLCILVSIYVPFSRVYLLEEPENFLHPWMQQKLINIMRDQALRNRTVFILTSHSATILNAARTDEILLVNAGKYGTRVVSVESSSELRSVLEQSKFGLGDLWVSGAIGGVPADA